MVMRKVLQGAVVSLGMDRGRGAGSALGEESGVDPGEVRHIIRAVSVLGLDVVPVPGIQVGPGVRVGGRGVAHLGDANDESFLALLGPAQQDMVAGY